MTCGIRMIVLILLGHHEFYIHRMHLYYIMKELYEKEGLKFRFDYYLQYFMGVREPVLERGLSKMHRCCHVGRIWAKSTWWLSTCDYGAQSRRCNQYPSTAPSSSSRALSKACVQTWPAAPLTSLDEGMMLDSSPNHRSAMRSSHAFGSDDRD